MTKYKVLKAFTHCLTGEEFIKGQPFPEGYAADSIERLLNDERGAFIEADNSVSEEKPVSRKPRTNKK